MSLWEDYYADYAYEINNPCNYEVWRTKDGKLIPVKEMTTQHIQNCMNFLDEDDEWCEVFQAELLRRKKKGEL